MNGWFESDGLKLARYLAAPPGRSLRGPVTRLPGSFSTGIGSPVIIDSSMLVLPSITRPSTGTFSPGRTRT